jgi:hypothetical protein
MCEFEEQNETELFGPVVGAEKYGHYFTIYLDDSQASYMLKVWVREFGEWLGENYLNKCAFYRTYYRVVETTKEYLEQLATIKRIELEEELEEMM